MKTRPLFFFAADDGSSGATALAEPIAPAGGEQPHDIATYEPPSVDDITAELERGGNDVDPPPPAVEKEPVKAPPAKPAAKKGEAKSAVKVAAPAKVEGDQRKPEEIPINELRTAYTSTKSELEKTRAELATLRTDHPELKTARTELEEAKKRLETLEKSTGDYERKLAFYNPSAAKKIADMDAAFNKEITPLLAEIPKVRQEYASLVREYAQLPHGKQEFEEAFENFEQTLVDKYGERKADRVLSLVTRGHRHLQEVGQAETELREDGGKFLFDQQSRDWSEGAKRFEEDSKEFLNVDPEIASADPYHPLFFLQHCEKEDGERFTELKDKLMQFSRRVSVGPKPRQKSDFPGMSDEQIADALKQDATQSAGEKRLAARMLVQAGLILSYHRPFWKQYKAMQERLGEDQLPDPSETDGKTTDKTPSATVAVGEYEPPAIPSDSEFYNV